MTVATDVRLEHARLAADIEDQSLLKTIDKNLDLARALKINGTPSLIIGDRIIRGAVDLPTLVALISEERNGRADRGAARQKSSVLGASR